MAPFLCFPKNPGTIAWEKMDDRFSRMVKINSGASKLKSSDIKFLSELKKNNNDLGKVIEILFRFY